MPSLRRLVGRLLPHALRCALRDWEILELEQGHLRSIIKQSSVDRSGSPIPWFSYPAIEYLQQLDLSDRSIFEYGAGNSTLYWARRARRVVSVERDEGWYRYVRARATANVAISHAPEQATYVGWIAAQPELFDLIVVDGPSRYACAEAALGRLRPGGMIIVDNADWHVKTTRLLREAGLIQIDMTGFGPINSYTSTTSFFLHREFNFRPAHEHQPTHGVGSLRQYANE